MLTVVISLLLWGFFYWWFLKNLFLFVFKICLKDCLILYILLAVRFIFSNTAVFCYMSHELWGHKCLWVLGQQNTSSSYPFHCVRSLFTITSWNYLVLDPSLTSLSSLGIEASIIALLLLPSRNSASLHTCFEGSLLFLVTFWKKMIVGEQKDDVGCLLNSEEKTIKACMSVKSTTDCR